MSNLTRHHSTAWERLLNRACGTKFCGHPAKRHHEEQPYPCNDCPCEEFQEIRRGPVPIEVQV